MPLEPAPLCVLIANFEPMMRLGMTRVLADDGVDVVMEDGSAADIVERARLVHPDAIVLGLEGDAHQLGAEVHAAAPDAKVILCSRDETTIEVLDPGASTLRRIDHAVPEALLRELSTQQAEGGTI